MQAITDFSARCLREPSSRKFPLVQLRFRGRDVGDPLAGALLERQFRLSGKQFLLFLTDDIPYEDTLRIYLLDDGFHVLDGLEFGGAYATGTLEDIAIKDADRIEFAFLHKNRYRLIVHPAAQWRQPLIFVPGVARIGAWFRKRYLAFDFLQPHHQRAD